VGAVGEEAGEEAFAEGFHGWDFLLLVSANSVGKKMCEAWAVRDAERLEF
jgi:hypothetical protein